MGRVDRTVHARSAMVLSPSAKATVDPLSDVLAARGAQGVRRGCAGPWNHGCLIGRKPPLKFREVWSIRIRLQPKDRVPDLAMFDPAMDGKLRGCDLVALRADDVLLSGRVRPRSTVVQKKTDCPVQT